MEPTAIDIVIRKARYNGFVGTDLDAILKGTRHPPSSVQTIFAGHSYAIRAGASLRSDVLP